MAEKNLVDWAADRPAWIGDSLRRIASSAEHLISDTDYAAIRALAFKNRIISQTLEGLDSQADLERALKFGADLLKPKLFAAADVMRAMCKHRVSIVLTGTRGIDSAEALERLFDTVRGLEALKS